MKEFSKLAARSARALGAVAMAAGSAALVTSCSAVAAQPASKEASHPLRADRLSEVMRTFDADVRRHVPAETDLHDRWEGVFPKIAKAAADLKIAALDLSGHPPKGLEIPARGRFQVLGQTLVDAAGVLQDAAERGDADAVAAARVRVGEACRDCHQRYRPNSPGVPDAFR